MVINQGDVFWVNVGDLSGSGPGHIRPFVIIQNNIFNRSRINSVVVCALTSNLRRAEVPGNVLLTQNEINLRKQSVVNISQLFAVDKQDLVEKIGTLSHQRTRQILAGIQLMLEPRSLD